MQVLAMFQSDGVGGLYAGLSASLLRQLTYSTTRFGMYESVKAALPHQEGPLPFYKKVLFWLLETSVDFANVSLLQVALASLSGACGGFVGTPGDMINVRMQNDVKLPPEQRRNYKFVFLCSLVVPNDGPLVAEGMRSTGWSGWSVRRASGSSSTAPPWPPPALSS